jgi:phosphate-selective porin OprO/OprP
MRNKTDIKISDGNDKTYFLVILFTALLQCSTLVNAQILGPQDTLVRNVKLTDPAGKVEDKVVNILIVAGKLEVVTEDKISRDEADKVVNANGGFIVGKLVVGESPSFMIFNDDPRKNFEVMLDTKTYSSFAVHDGIVIKNRLMGVRFDDPDDEPVKSGWLAYTPPPMAIPMNYQDSSKWNRFETKWVSGIFTGALALDRMNWLSQDTVSEAQFGDLNNYDGGEIRALRFGVFGTLNFEKPWVYTIAGATNAFDKGFETENKDDITLFDWRLDIPFFKNSVMSIGKQKEPISMERLTGMVFLPWQERSAVADAILPSRNVGIVWNGNSPEKYSSWAFGVFNDWFDADQDFSDSASQFVGRLTWVPFRTEDESNLLHLGLGYRYSDAKEGFRFRSEPEFNKSPVFVDTAFGNDVANLPADKVETYNLELSWRKGPFWLASEYFRTAVKNPALEDPVFDGYYVSASWILTGEMRLYNKKNGLFRPVPISRTVYQNGKGAWEISARYSDVNLTDGKVEGGDVQIGSLGLNWWLTPFFSLGVNYRYIWNSQNELDGTSSGFTTRILLMLD